MDAKSPYFEALSSGLEKLWTTGDHHDVTIEVGERTFNCHKAVLAAMSDYFDAMFRSSMRESISGHVTFPEMEPDLFEIVINFLYTGKADINGENAIELLHQASVLQIKSLQRLCEEFLHPHLTMDNCLKVWKLAVLHDCDNLAGKAVKMIATNFMELCKTEEFMELEGKEVSAILNEDDLDVESEDKLCDIALKWINKDKESRVQHAGIIFENIRLPFIKPEYLVNLEESFKFLKEDATCMKCINEAKRYHLLPARQQEMNNKQTRYRATAELEEVLVLLGGCLTTSPPYSRSLKVPCYSFARREWFEVSPLPFDPGIEFATCTYKRDIYLTGGGSMQSCLLWYVNSTSIQFFPTHKIRNRFFEKHCS